MSAYDSYNKSGFGGGGEEQGGFFTDSQQGSQDARAKSYQDQSLRPATIKQLLGAEEPYGGSDCKVDGVFIKQVTIVGQVRKIDARATFTNYRLDDGTGQIDVKKWVNPEKQEESAPTFELDSYIRVWGVLKSPTSQPYLSAHIMRPVTDFNEVNYHLLEAAYVHLYFTRGPVGQNGAAADGDSMFVDGGAGYSNGTSAAAGGGQLPSKLSGCQPGAKKMFTFMSNTPGGNEGVHLNVVSSGTGMPIRDVLTAADELLSIGVIYETVDRETWAVLEY